MASMLLGGLIFVGAAICAKFFLDAFILRQLQLNLPLSPNSTNSSNDEITSYQLWKDIPFPVKNRFYFFHVENPLEVSRFKLLVENIPMTNVGPCSLIRRMACA